MTESGRPLAVITGASSGIGEALARLLAAQGYDLVIAARRTGELNRVAGVLSSRHPVAIVPVTVDLSHREGPAILADDIARRGLAPAVVINNAGFGLNGEAALSDPARQLAIVDVNVRALTALTLQFLPALIERGAGGILNIASLAALVPGPRMAVYFATKTYILSFGEALAREVRGSGVTVSTCCPGPVDTEFFAVAGMEGIRLLRWFRPRPADLVARAAWDGFRAGRTVVYPGFLDHASAIATRFAPRGLATAVTHWVNSPARRRRRP